MGRPHVEFIQSQAIPFTRGLYGGARSGIDCRVLSRDEETGAASTVLRYPPGWRQDQPQALNADEELFVLDGALEINGATYGKHVYAHLPKGYPRRSMSSAMGAAVLTFFSGEPSAALAPSSPNFDARKLVERLDTRRMPGHTGKRTHMNTGDWDPSGTVHKSLYADPDTGERTWLIGLMPYWSTDRAEIHPVVEEEFAILGDICFPLGVMRDGGYFWRPPGIKHGPFATWGGTLHLCRCKGGPFATEWVATDGPDWEPPYTPIMDERYRRHVAEAADLNREPNY
ncbi:MAG: DUF4437 domain-containing protein [Rhodospirillaceae bacterium]|nr:DUF4437 domain-containing protein [Rhodospirillaceae bacterium]